MSIYEPFDRLVTIRILGQAVQVPENNTLLRGLQYACPETVPYGKFCWNNDCNHCEHVHRDPETGEERYARGCQLRVTDGLEVLKVSMYLRMVLGPILDPPDAARPPGGGPLRPPGG